MPADPVLAVRGLARDFGGLAAVADVSLDLAPGEIHALIGPNGAGKTTLINLLSGELGPSAGSIRYLGAEIAGLAPHRIARLGIARSYQRTNIFPELTAFEGRHQERIIPEYVIERPLQFVVGLFEILLGWFPGGSVARKLHHLSFSPQQIKQDTFECCHRVTLQTWNIAPWICTTS